ncbi:hypothetical protein ECT184097_2120 [Escherichia coli T1840_97]|nr:hypothetical protein ECT184097_2120 [Escherichia coli T1840_97]
MQDSILTTVVKDIDGEVTVYSCDSGANFPLLQLHHRGGH